jgi:3-oxoacyl-[acyl-carrier protein] reductase
VDQRLSQTRAVVTGAAGGIGSAVVDRLLDAGAVVLAVDRVPPRETPAVLAAGNRLQVQTADVSLEGEVDGLVEHLRTNGFVPTALVAVHGMQVRGPLEKLTTKHWDLVLRVNLSSAFYLLRALAPSISQASIPRVVTFSSAYVAAPGAEEAAYIAAKSALEGLTRAAALEYASTGMTVNAIAPGLVWHEGLRGVWPADAFEDLLSRIPIGRMGTPGEVAGLVEYLLSPQAGYITGQILHIDGGLAV